MDRVETVLTFITEELLEDDDIEINEDTSLFQDRVLSSLNLVALISFIEDTFDFKVKTSEVSISNFDSVNQILDFLDKKNS